MRRKDANRTKFLFTLWFKFTFLEWPVFCADRKRIARSTQDEESMTRLTLIAAFGALALASPGFAGDAEKGMKEFNKCKACHSITAEDGTVIQKGGKVGPNLYGVVGRPVASYPDFKYGPGIVAAGEAGAVWDEANLVSYVKDPSAWLKEVTANPAAKSNMVFKLAKGGEDVVAYLASVAPAAPETN
ncbi:cytochrome C [Paracoccaceae bacterium Fryx2]|nr:cytochrome C [Paracoccaceae bacterium Fryx2]